MSMFRKSGESAATLMAAPPVQGTAASLSAEHRAALAYRRGDKDAALELYRDAARQAPADAGVQKALADFYLVGLNRPDEAYSAYQHVLDLTPHDPAVLQILGNICASSQKFGEARRYFSTLADVQPSNPIAQKALSALPPEGGLAVTPDAFRAMIEEAQRSMNTSNGIGVEDALDKLMQFKSRNVKSAAAAPVLTYEEICTIASQGKDDEAIAGLEQFVAAHPRDGRAHNDLGVLYYRAGSAAKALEEYRTAVECEPREIIYRKNLADLTYIELRDPEAALRHYVEILTISPRDAETLLALAQVCVDLQKDNDALVFLDTLLGNEPWNTQAREMRSALQVRQTLPGGTQPGLNALDAAGAALASGRRDEAIRLLEQHVQTSPQDASARNDLGVLYYQSGRVADAGVQYEEAVRLDPGNDIYAQNLADFCVVEAGRPEDALRIYVRILEKKPRDVDTLLGIGRICEVLGRGQDAKDFYRKALDAEPWNTAARDQWNRLGA
ncbi:MAG: tetratricopeptide repeat protein [Ignavibacteriae bacterium]|nr:tetratricopeptide repeat protein [Ignavibacteriota bacterium]